MYGPTTNMSMHKYIICVVVLVSVFFIYLFLMCPVEYSGVGGGG